MLALPPIIAELLIPIAGLVTAFAGWRLALFTKRESRKRDC